MAEDSNPLNELTFEKETKAEFLNKYTALVYHLKIKRNNLIILNELLTFIRKFVFLIDSNELRIKKIDNEKGETTGAGTWDDLLKSLRLDNLMELYDYMQYMTTRHEYSEHNKENILNLVIQVLNVYEKFKGQVSEIRHLIKLVQGDQSSVEYFMQKILLRDDNASYAINTFKNLFQQYIESKNANLQKKSSEKENMELLAISERKKLIKKAEEGISSYKDLYLLIKGEADKEQYIAFSDLRIVLFRLGLNMTKHRIAEIVSAAKRRRLIYTVGSSSLEFESIESKEFCLLFELIQRKVYSETLDSLSIAPRNLAAFSLACMFIFLFNIHFTSQIINYIFKGGLLAALICAIIPLAAAFIMTHIKSVETIESEKGTTEIKDNFEKVTSASINFNL